MKAEALRVHATPPRKETGSVPFTMSRVADGAAAEAAANAYYETEARAIGHIAGGYARKGAAGTRLVVWTVPDAGLNVVRVGHQRDLREVDAFARELSATGLPWSIQVRGDVDPELRELALRYGRTGTSMRPLLYWDAGSLPALPAALPDGAAVRKVSGADSGEFAAVLAAGFGLAEDTTRPLSQPAFAWIPAVLDAPGITGFLLDRHGKAVATQLNVLAGQYAGIYSVSVPPPHRRHGYSRALLTACLADAVARGARLAVSTNSPMSRPLFESAGFRLAETWTNLTPAP